MTDDPEELAPLLRELYLSLEAKGLQGGKDHHRAMALEDLLGSGGGFSTDDVANAQALLRRHGFE